MTYPPYGDQPDPSRSPDQPHPDPSQSADQPQPPPDPYSQQPYGQPQPPPYQQPYGQPYGQPQPSPYQQPYGQQGYGQQPYGYQPPATTNGMAIASLVVSIISITAFCGLTSIVGAILGHIARKQVRDRGENGGGLALAGIIVGWIGVALVLIVVAVVVAVALTEEASDPTYY
ncbi:MAG TPA: DUF4190 domain-containing protein [Acidimicrobiales bacterium]